MEIDQIVKNFIEYWQTFMTKWLEFAESQKETLNKFLNEKDEFLKYGDAYKSFSNYIPEPYFGNPENLIDDKIHAIFINLNPGSAGPSQSYFDEGSYLKDFKKNDSNYQKTLDYWNRELYCYLKLKSNLEFDLKSKKIKKNKYNQELKKNSPSAYGTLIWWNDYRAKWVDTFLKPNNIDYQIEIQHILGLELSPWHSTKFTDIKDIDIAFAKKNVVDIAVKFSKVINNPFLRNNEHSIVLTCGAGFKFFFIKEIWEDITPDFLKIKWQVWKWKYNENTSILCFHQINTNGPVPLNFPNDIKIKKDMQDFISEQLKKMLA